MATPADIEDMLARISLGDRSAFSTLYDATSARLFGVCLSILKDRSEAEDALQDAFLRIWTKAGSYAQNGLSPMTWLIALARNIAIDRLRARARRPDPDDGLDRIRDDAPSPEAAAIAGSELRRIDACLDELEPAPADAVRGAYLEGHSYKDLARRHEVPLNTMRTWLRRSLVKLRDCLER